MVTSFRKSNLVLLLSMGSLIYNKHQWQISTRLHGVTTQKTVFFIVTPVQPQISHCKSNAASKISLLFNRENGGDIFLRNVGRHSLNYTALYPRRQNPSEPPLREPRTQYVRLLAGVWGENICWKTMRLRGWWCHLISMFRSIKCSLWSKYEFRRDY
jgi:hypothetical protein